MIHGLNNGDAISAISYDYTSLNLKYEKQL